MRFRGMHAEIFLWKAGGPPPPYLRFQDMSAKGVRFESRYAGDSFCSNASMETTEGEGFRFGDIGGPLQVRGLTAERQKQIPFGNDNKKGGMRAKGGSAAGGMVEKDLVRGPGSR